MPETSEQLGISEAATSEPERAAMPFPVFAHRLLVSLAKEPAADVAPAALLFDDLGLDSFDVLQMVVAIEEWADLIVAEEDLPAMWTIGDAYDYYLSACEVARRQW